MILEIEELFDKYFSKKWDRKNLDLFLGNVKGDFDVNALQESINIPVRDFILRGGKRMRPVFFLTLLRLFGFSYRKYFDLALFIELVHNGTLIIDDIEDDSDLRRGEPVCHKKFGMDVAVNTGVFLHIAPLKLIEASPCVTKFQRSRLLSIYSKEILGIYLGQALDISWHTNQPSSVTEERYFSMCRLKTGALFRMSARFACVVSGRRSKTEDLFSRFAEDMGVAFQIKDDVLDLTADRKKFGKRFGNDITEGKISLPVVYAFKLLSRRDRECLMKILKDHTRDRSRIETAIRLIEGCGAITASTDRARIMATKAWDNIEPYSSRSPHLNSLKELTHSIIMRDH
jgi:geranylgeranyl diphosphate synthase, type I